MRRATLRVDDMMCVGCEDALARALSAREGVEVEGADFSKCEVRVRVEAGVEAEALRRTVRDAGYTCSRVDFEGSPADDALADGASANGGSPAGGAGASADSPADRPRRDLTALYLLIILGGLYVIARQLGLTDIFSAFPTVGTEKIGWAALFGVGLLTSVHCIAMCGGINLAQSVSGDAGGPLARALLYNAGRLTSYTLVGGALGALGQAVAVTAQMRAVVGVAAGVCMVVVGVGMAGRFSFMRRLSPRLPSRATEALRAFARTGPFAVGLANGFMPCGPLQAMQLYAVASGGFLAGASSMLFFCLGTIPLMFAFSGAAGALKSAWRKTMMQVSSAVIVLLGAVMAANSASILGVELPWLGATSAEEAEVVAAELQDDGTQLVVTQLYEDGYDDIQVSAGVPVVWIVEVDEEALNGCNNQIVCTTFDLTCDLTAGSNVIEFTPAQTGTYTFSCWMGMLHGTIEVVE